MKQHFQTSSKEKNWDSNPSPSECKSLTLRQLFQASSLHPYRYLEKPCRAPVQFWIKIILASNVFLTRYLIFSLWTITVSEKAVPSIWQGNFWMYTFPWIFKTMLADLCLLLLSPKVNTVWPCWNHMFFYPLYFNRRRQVMGASDCSLQGSWCTQLKHINWLVKQAFGELFLVLENDTTSRKTWNPWLFKTQSCFRQESSELGL